VQTYASEIISDNKKTDLTDKSNLLGVENFTNYPMDCENLHKELRFGAHRENFGAGDKTDKIFAEKMGAKLEKKTQKNRESGYFETVLKKFHKLDTTHEKLEFFDGFSMLDQENIFKIAKRETDRIASQLRRFGRFISIAKDSVELKILGIKMDNCAKVKMKDQSDVLLGFRYLLDILMSSN
jgi:hypothetical protein